MHQATTYLLKLMFFVSWTSDSKTTHSDSQMCYAHPHKLFSLQPASVISRSTEVPHPSWNLSQILVMSLAISLFCILFITLIKPLHGSFVASLKIMEEFSNFR